MKIAKTKNEAEKVVPTGLIVYGLENGKKPKAARFSGEQAELASKAAVQLNLSTLRIAGQRAQLLASKLPAGRIHANGRGFVPYVRTQTFEEILAIAKKPAKAAAADAKADVKSAPAHRLPKNWDDISEDSVVIANDSMEEGWYEAVVVERRGDMLDLRWRDWPRERKFARHVESVGLLFTEEFIPPSLKPRASRKAKKADALSGAELRIPASWKDIDLQSLVLMKEDGPWRSYWEGVPIKLNGDMVTARWRDFPTVPSVDRDRHALGLLYPQPE